MLLIQSGELNEHLYGKTLDWFILRVFVNVYMFVCVLLSFSVLKVGCEL